MTFAGTGLGKGLRRVEFEGISVGTWASMEESCCGVITLRSERNSSSLLTISNDELDRNPITRSHIPYAAYCPIDHGLLL